MKVKDEADLTTKPTCWHNMKDAPKDGTPILAKCIHSTDAYFIDDGKHLTNYGSACEALGHIDDGFHVVYWEPESVEGSWEESYYTVPGYWAVNGSSGETCANPVMWMPIPDC